MRCPNGISGHGYMFAYLDVRVQLFLRDFELIMEGELKETVEDGGGHMVQVDEAFRGLPHSGLGQGSEILAALRESPEVDLKNELLSHECS